MSDKATIWTFSEYFLACPQLFLIQIQVLRGIFLKDTFARYASVRSIFV